MALWMNLAQRREGRAGGPSEIIGRCGFRGERPLIWREADARMVANGSEEAPSRMTAQDARDLFGKLYPDGAVIFREGDAGAEMFIVQEGQVEISATIDGERAVLGVVEKGQFFGEMALFDDKPRSATAVVKGSARLMVLSRSTVKDRLQDDPHIGLSLLRGMCQRLRSLYSNLEDLIARGELDPARLEATLRAHAAH